MALFEPKLVAKFDLTCWYSIFKCQQIQFCLTYSSVSKLGSILNLHRKCIFISIMILFLLSFLCILSVNRWCIHPFLTINSLKKSQDLTCYKWIKSLQTPPASGIWFKYTELNPDFHQELMLFGPIFYRKKGFVPNIKLWTKKFKKVQFKIPEINFKAKSCILLWILDKIQCIEVLIFQILILIIYFRRKKCIWFNSILHVKYLTNPIKCQDVRAKIKTQCQMKIHFLCEFNIQHTWIW